MTPLETCIAALRAGPTDAFFKAIVDFAANQSKLDSILSDLDKVQKDAYTG